MTSGVVPVGRLDAEQVRAVLSAAMAAPSPYAGPPWHCRCTATTIELYADARVPDDRALLRSCGAALLNLRLAVRALGVRPAVQLLPDPHRPHLLAIVALQGHTAVLPVDRRLADAITRRRDQVGPFRHLAVPASVVAELRAAARSEQAWLPTITGAYLPILSGLVDQAHLPDLRSDPLVAVVGTFHDSPLARLQAGQATQRVLLTATVAGLSASLVTQVLDEPVPRGQLRELVIGGLWPQAVLRLGFGARVSGRASPLVPELGGQHGGLGASLHPELGEHA